MKRVVFLAITMILAGVSQAAEVSYKLSEAIQKKLVTVNITGAKYDTTATTNYSERKPCMAMEIVSVTGDALNLNLEYGYKLEPEDTNMQIMMVSQTLIVKLQPKQKKNYRLYAMCTEATDGGPKPTEEFNLTKRFTGNLLDLAKIINDKKYQSDAAQDAVWCLTDNHDMSSISSDDTSMMYTLRRFIAKVKGLKMAAVYAPVGSITPTYHATVTYSGSLTYSYSNTSKIMIALFDEENHMKKVYVDEAAQRPGEYTYNYQIGSDEMGDKKHYLRMFRNGKLTEEIAIIPRE